MSDVFDRFGDELVAAARRRHKRRRRARRLGAVAAGVLLFGVISAGLSSRDSAQASSITVEHRPDGRVVLRLARPNASAEAVVDDLEQAGFLVETVLLATGPSRVGRVISLATTSSGFQEDGGVVLDPGGVVRVTAGRRAEPGETYQADTDAFAPEEPLGCMGRPGMAVAALVELVADLDVRVRWRDISGVDIDLPGRDDDRYVQAALASSAEEVTVLVGAEPPFDIDRSGCAPS